MSSYVQSSTVVNFTGDAASKNISITLSAGNSCVVTIDLTVYTSTEPVLTVSDGTNSYNAAFDLWASGITDRIKCAQYYLHNNSAGAKTITVSFTGPAFANVYGDVQAHEISGLQNTTPIAKTNSGTSTSPSTGATSALGQAANFVLAQMMAADAGIDLPTNFTNIRLDNDTSGNPPNSVDYRVINDASALTVSWGTIATSVGWAAGVAVYPDNTSTPATLFAASIF